MTGSGNKRVLSNGVSLPEIGFGTSGLEGDAAVLIKAAVKSGYRLIDTASAYGTEEAVGTAVRELIDSGEIRRDELFIQSKIAPRMRGYNAAKREFERTLELLQTDYLDMYLMHWPVPRDPENYREENIEIWTAFEELYKAGRVRAIGVCNFLERHLLQLTEACEITPMINQLEIHPAYQQRGLVGFCRERGIVVEAWSPFGRGVLNDPRFIAMAKRYNKNIGQLALRWSVEKELIPISRSSDTEHIRANTDIFDFTILPEDMSALDSLNSANGHLDVWCYDNQQMY